MLRRLRRPVRRGLLAVAGLAVVAVVGVVAQPTSDVVIPSVSDRASDPGSADPGSPAGGDAAAGTGGWWPDPRGHGPLTGLGVDGGGGAISAIRPPDEPDGDAPGGDAPDATDGLDAAGAEPSGAGEGSAADDGQSSVAQRPPPVTTGFPDASTTGVPAGTSLSPYTGSCDITRDGTVIEARTISCWLRVDAADVVIRASRLEGVVHVENDDASLTIEDTEIDGGREHTAAVGYRNVTIRRSHIYGAQHGVNCVGNCRVENSYIHSQYVPPDGDWHLQPFLSNGASGVTLVGNTLSCTAGNTPAGGGCTANVSIFGDFTPNADFLIENNLLVASPAVGYCVYGGTDPGKPYGTQVSGIRYVDNVFQRGTNGACGYWGPVTSFDPSAPGNVWENNVWDDGTPVSP